MAAFHGYNFLLARENLTDHLPLDQRKNKTRQRLLKIRAKKVITATGSLERPLIFDNNDRPGILLSSAIDKYANFFGVACGKKNVLFTNNDSAYETAISLYQKGINIEAIIDNREEIDSKLIKETEKNNIKVYKGYTVVDTSGYKRINKVSIMQLSKDGQKVVGSKISIKCDCLGISGGWTPAVHLFTQSGGKLKFRDEDQVFIPDIYPSDQISIGSCNGDFTLDEILSNVPQTLKDFLNLKKIDYDNLEVQSSFNKSKRNIWLLPSDKVNWKNKTFC